MVRDSFKYGVLFNIHLQRNSIVSIRSYSVSRVVISHLFSLLPKTMESKKTLELLSTGPKKDGPIREWTRYVWRIY